MSKLERPGAVEATYLIPTNGMVGDDIPFWYQYQAIIEPPETENAQLLSKYYNNYAANLENFLKIWVATEIEEQPALTLPGLVAQVNPNSEGILQAWSAYAGETGVLYNAPLATQIQIEFVLTGSATMLNLLEEQEQAIQVTNSVMELMNIVQDMFANKQAPANFNTGFVGSNGTSQNGTVEVTVGSTTIPGIGADYLGAVPTSTLTQADYIKLNDTMVKLTAIQSAMANEKLGGVDFSSMATNIKKVTDSYPLGPNSSDDSGTMTLAPGITVDYTLDSSRNDDINEVIQYWLLSEGPPPQGVTHDQEHFENIGLHIRSAVSSLTTASTDAEDALRKAMFTYSEFYKTAGSMIKVLDTILMKMGRKIG